MIRNRCWDEQFTYRGKTKSDIMHKFITGILVLLVVTGIAWIMLLTQQVVQLERQLGPVIARQAMENRQHALRDRFIKRMAQDKGRYSQTQVNEAENLMGIADQKWGTPEATESLQTLITRYPESDRAGCALLYVAQQSQGVGRAKYLQDCINKYDDCFYGDGVQVGAYARFLLARDYQSNGDTEKARALFDELKSKYPGAIDHRGALLLDNLSSNVQPD